MTSEAKRTAKGFVIEMFKQYQIGNIPAFRKKSIPNLTPTVRSISVQI